MQAHSFFSGSIFFLLSAPLDNKSLDMNKLRTSSITSILQGFVYCEPSAVAYLVVKQSESFLAPIHPLNLLKTDLSSLPRSSCIVPAHHVPMSLETPSRRKHNFTMYGHGIVQSHRSKNPPTCNCYKNRHGRLRPHKTDAFFSNIHIV